MSNSGKKLSTFEFLFPCKETEKLVQIALTFSYSIVKDSSTDLGVNFKIVQNRQSNPHYCPYYTVCFSNKIVPDLHGFT